MRIRVRERSHAETGIEMSGRGGARCWEEGRLTPCTVPPRSWRQVALQAPVEREPAALQTVQGWRPSARSYSLERWFSYGPSGGVALLAGRPGASRIRFCNAAPGFSPLMM